MEWKPDRPVDAALAERLVHDQFAALRPVHAEPVGAGWDNAVHRINGEWFFRFPVREFAVPGVRKEIDCLPRLARLVPGVAEPKFIGAPQGDYPWPFFGYIPLPGREVCEVEMSDEARASLARPVAAFLRHLHSPAVAAALDGHLPGDIHGRLDMAKRVPRAWSLYERCLKACGTLPIAERAVRAILEAARESPLLPATAVVHGDFHFRHVIVDGSGAFAGAIDWGDMLRGNPAMDLMLAWSLFPPAPRAVFWSEYGPVSDAQLAQSRLLSLYLALTLLEYAVAENLDSIRREAIRGLAWLAIS